MFKIFKDFGARIANLALWTRLVKLRVFYQVLILTILMIIFLAIQLFTGLRVIDNMQGTTQEIFSNSVDSLNEISKFKNELAQIQIIFLQTMAGKDPVGLGSSRNILMIKGLIDRVKNTQGIDEKSREKLIENLNSLGSVIETNSTYEQLKESIDQLYYAFDSAFANIRISAVNQISNSETYTTQSKLIAIGIMVISFILSIMIALIITNSLSKSLKVMEVAAQSLAVGNLSKNINTEGCPEVVRVLKGLNQAIFGLRDLVKGINSQSEFLDNASKELKQASSETGKATTEVTKAMEELAKGSAEQSQQITQAVKTIDLLSQMVKKVSEDVESIATSSEQVAQSAKGGQNATKDVSNQINELYDSTIEVAEVINVLSKSSSEISEITSVIHEIAERTTLLALNASIEAARAGEQGKGFGVVAVETGKLAEQSKHAAGLISDLVAQMKVRTDQAVAVMQKGIARAEEGKNLISEANQTFEEIFQSLRNNSTQIDTVAASAKTMARSNEEVIQSISVIAAISEEYTAGTEEVSAIAEEQSSSVEEVTALAENLIQIADSLRRYVAVFELGSDFDDGTAIVLKTAGKLQ